MKIGNLGNQGNQNINGNVSNHCNLDSHVNGGGGGGGGNNNNNNNKYQETMTLKNYRKQPYWALHTYFGKC